MTLKEFFDLRMIVLLLTQAILVTIMTKMSPTGTLDARLFYSDLDANFFLQSLTPDLLNNYRFVEYLDLFFIYKYTRTMVLALMRLHPHTKLWALSLIPAFLDLSETISIVLALHNPHRILPAPGLGYVTCLKWVAASGVVGFILFSLRKLKSTRTI